MNKAELIAAIAAKTGETKKSAEETVNAFVSVVTDALKKGEKVQIILDNVFDKKTYNMIISKKPYTALCVDLFNEEEIERIKEILDTIKIEFKKDIS